MTHTRSGYPTILSRFCDLHEGVDPTNDASERAIRFLVRFRKMCGQLKGGRRSMERLGHFATCVMTWWAHDKAVYNEVSKAVVARP